MLQNSPLDAAGDTWTPAASPTSGSGKRDHDDRLREAVRAIAELRRGATVVLRDGGVVLAFAVLETVQPAGMADLLAWGATPWLAAPMESQLESRVVARRLTRGELGSDSLRALVDQATQPGFLDDLAELPPAGTACAVALAKLGHLLPTLIVASSDASGMSRARTDGAVIVEASQIAGLRAAKTRLVRVGEASVPLEDAAVARVVAFRNPDTGAEHIAVVIGDPDVAQTGPAPLVRLHSECFTGDVLGSLRCDCGPQLRSAIRRMADEGAGVVLYLAQEGRGIGLLNKLRAYALQDRGLDTVDANAALGWLADERDFSLAAAMLRDLGMARVRLMTNNPAKVAALMAAGIVVERTSLLVAANGVNDGYLATKAARFGHLLG
jgi:GTP cyclohydrolase II